jgi:hypothetical protein
MSPGTGPDRIAEWSSSSPSPCTRPWPPGSITRPRLGPIDPLSQQTLLHLTPGIRTRFDTAGHVLVDAPDGTVVDIGPRGYAFPVVVLATGDSRRCDRPARERRRGSTDFVPALSLINMLIEEGALIRPDEGGRSLA